MSSGNSNTEENKPDSAEGSFIKLDNENKSVCLDTTLQVNYANNISASLNFEGLDSFIEDNEYIFSRFLEMIREV